MFSLVLVFVVNKYDMPGADFKDFLIEPSEECDAATERLKSKTAQTYNALGSWSVMVLKYISPDWESIVENLQVAEIKKKALLINGRCSDNF